MTLFFVKVISMVVTFDQEVDAALIKVWKTICQALACVYHVFFASKFEFDLTCFLIFFKHIVLWSSVSDGLIVLENCLDDFLVVSQTLFGEDNSQRNV